MAPRARWHLFLIGAALLFLAVKKIGTPDWIAGGAAAAGGALWWLARRQVRTVEGSER